MRITPIPCLEDNYAYLLASEATNDAVIIDASEAAPVMRAMAEAGVTLRAVWSTHHHWDHVGGNEEVAAKHKVDVYGYATDRGRLPGQTRFVEEGERWTTGPLRVLAIHIPGHTLGAVAYVVSDEIGPGAVFTGDTLFIAGCGRLFEGTPAQMHASLSKLAALPATTRVYCGHEYTEANLRFARSVEPGNADITLAAEQARRTRSEKRPTVPSTLADEAKTNPFLRVRSLEIRRTLGISQDSDDATAFAEIRKAKDGFH